MNWKLIEDKSWCSLEQRFEWVREMNTVQQDIYYHAEGSVAEHTRMVLEALQQSSAYHSLSTLEKELIWTFLKKGYFNINGEMNRLYRILFPNRFRRKNSRFFTSILLPQK